MPGLRRQPGVSSYTNSMHHADMLTPPAVHPRYSWDREKSVMPRRVLTTRQTIPTRPPKCLGRDYLGTTKAVTVCYGSNESDDLQAMVHDFIENDSLEFLDDGDSDGLSSRNKPIETLQMRIATLNGLERELLTEVKRRLLSIKEDSDLVCDPGGTDCKGACVKRFVVKHLKVAGYDAAVCMSKWLSSGRVPGGEYEYIDVAFNDEPLAERLIIDVDFRAQFEIARPTQQYEAVLKILPAVFVGSASKLKKILEFMSDAAKVSLKQNHMPLPPWRTLDYMSSKWLSTFHRKTTDATTTTTTTTTTPLSPTKQSRSFPEKKHMLVAKQCSEQLRHTKLALVAEMKASGIASKRSPRATTTTTNLR